MTAEFSDFGNGPKNPVDPHVLLEEYLNRAHDAIEAGEDVLGTHLYLAAFEQASSAAELAAEEAAAKGEDYPAEITPLEDAAINGLRTAWELACASRERSLAEHVLEKLQPFLTPEETQDYADQLQVLALGQLEDMGLSEEDVRNAADLLGQNLAAMGGLPAEFASGAVAPAGDAGGNPLAGLTGVAGFKHVAPGERITFADVPGYRSPLRAMRSLGIGRCGEEGFQDLVAMLNERHGTDGLPTPNTLVFRSVVREDATRFMDAVVGELNMPMVRMRMEENLQGAVVLCVLADVPNLKSLNIKKGDLLTGGLLNSGVLILEDIDMWVAPFLEEDAEDGKEAQLTKGAREAMMLIRSAVENPNVYVLASASLEYDVDPFFCDVLAPFTAIEIENPTAEERVEIWLDIRRRHPSISGIPVPDLVRYSANMPRYDMYMAVREAIDEAYKEGLATGGYVPVSRENMFEKLAAYQPLESREYKELEDAAVADFMANLGDLDDLLKG